MRKKLHFKPETKKKDEELYLVFREKSVHLDCFSKNTMLEEKNGKNGKNNYDKKQ